MGSRIANNGKGKTRFNDMTKIEGIKSPLGQRVLSSNHIADEDNFMSLYKVSKETFDYICLIVKNRMMSRNKWYMCLDGKTLYLNDQVAISLTRLSSTDKTTSIANLFKTDAKTVSDITSDFVEALLADGARHLLWPIEMSHIIPNFEKIGGFVNCCGAIETIHLKTYPYNNNNKVIWQDADDDHGLMLQVVVGPTMRFLDVITAWPQTLTTASVLEKSDFFESVRNGEKLNGIEIELADGIMLREYIVGRSGYPLLPWLITPYDDYNLTEDQIEFNEKHFATRLVAWHALEKLKSVWAVIDGSEWELERVELPRIIRACCILHNIVIDKEDDGGSGKSVMISWEYDSSFQPERTPEADDNAVVMRNELCLYLAGKFSA